VEARKLANLTQRDWQQRCAEKGPHAGYDADQKLKMTVYGKEIGRIRRREPAPIHIQRWRNRLVTPQRQRQSANRIYRALVARSLGNTEFEN
jgi:hypothetical protein